MASLTRDKARQCLLRAESAIRVVLITEYPYASNANADPEVTSDLREAIFDFIHSWIRNNVPPKAGTPPAWLHVPDQEKTTMPERSDLENMNWALVNAFHEAIKAERTAGAAGGEQAPDWVVELHVAAFAVAKHYGWDGQRDEDFRKYVSKSTAAEALTEGMTKALAVCTPLVTPKTAADLLRECMELDVLGDAHAWQNDHSSKSAAAGLRSLASRIRTFLAQPEATDGA